MQNYIIIIFFNQDEKIFKFNDKQTTLHIILRYIISFSTKKIQLQLVHCVISIEIEIKTCIKRDY